MPRHTGVSIKEGAMANRVVHWEVMGRNGKALRDFYSRMFDWEFNTDAPGDYGVVRAPEGGIGGGVGSTPEGTEGVVTFYVETDDVDAHLRRAEELGGKVFMPKTEVMEGLTIGLFTDPEGHVIGLVKAAPQS